MAQISLYEIAFGDKGMFYSFMFVAATDVLRYRARKR